MEALVTIVWVALVAGAVLTAICVIGFALLILAAVAVIRTVVRAYRRRTHRKAALHR